MTERSLLPEPLIAPARGLAQWHGLRARGGFTVDIQWKGGKVSAYRITSAQPREVAVRVDGKTFARKSETPTAAQTEK